MRIVCAPDSFKGSLDASSAASAMAQGVLAVWPDAEVVELPGADGGEGTAFALTTALGGDFHTVEVTNALGRPVTARFGMVGERGIIEVAAACGLAGLDPAELDPVRASSSGVGELLRTALDAGAQRLLIGLGGSATTDAGVGMLTALGARFLGRDEQPIRPGELVGLHRVDLAGLDPRLARCRIELAVDVDNPLLGPQGAARVFAPQKGASPAQVEALEAGLTRWADIVETQFQREVRDLPGAGAAGGLGAAFALLGAVMRPGVEVVLDTLGFAEKVVGADWVFTGEGRLDAQTRSGKAPWGVARAAAALGVPTVVFAGRIAADFTLTADDPVDWCVQISDPDDPAGLRAAAERLSAAVAGFCRVALDAQLPSVED